MDKKIKKCKVVGGYWHQSRITNIMSCGFHIKTKWDNHFLKEITQKHIEECE